MADLTSSEPLPTMMDHALALMARGFSVFPVWGVDEGGACRCERPGCSSPGRYARSHEGRARSGLSHG